MRGVAGGKRYNEYRSGFCRMYTIKNAMLLKWPQSGDGHHDLRIDIRTPGKTYEELYERARQAGIHSVQGRPCEIREVPGSRNLIVRADNVSLGRPMEYEFEMVGLRTAAISSDGSEELARARRRCPPIRTASPWNRTRN